MAFALALDFGGTKLAAALVDCSLGQVIDRERLATPPTAQESLKMIFAAGNTLQQKAKACHIPVIGVGISFGGPVSADKKFIGRSMHIPGWEDFPLPQSVSQHFGLPAFLENDANAAAFGEWKFGAGKGFQHMLYIQVSTGIGAGLILKGSLYHGAGSAGEFGHMTIEAEGPLCTCGKHGCVESLASGWAIALAARQVFSDLAEDSILRQNNSAALELIEARHVIEAAHLGDPAAQSILTKAFNKLGIAIANAANLLDPQVIVIGGGLSKAGELLMKPVLETYQKHILSASPLPIVFSKLGDDAPLLGAAALIPLQVVKLERAGTPTPALSNKEEERSHP